MPSRCAMLPRPTLIIDYILAVSSHAVSGEEFRNPFFFDNHEVWGT